MLNAGHLYRVLSRVSPLEWLLRFIFGKDIFISYSHKDGTVYATRLAERLGRRGFNCVIDAYEGIPGSKIPSKVIRALKRSSQLVVVGTYGAANSKHVTTEIQEFRKVGRSIVVIGFDGSVLDADWKYEILGIPVLNGTSKGQLRQIVGFIRTSFRYRRQRQRQLIASVSVSALLVLGGFGLAYLTRQATALKGQVNKVTQTLSERQKELLKTEIALRETTRQVEQEKRLAEARRMVSDLQARRSARSYSPPEDILQAVKVSDSLAGLGLGLEANAPLTEAIEALPRRMRSFQVAAPVHKSAWAGDRLLIVNGNRRIVEVWNPRLGRQVDSLPHAEAVSNMAASADGKFAATWTNGSVTTLWELAPKAKQQGIYSFAKCCSAGTLAVSREGRYIAVSCGGSVKIFEKGGSPNGEESEEIEPPNDLAQRVKEMQFSKDLRYLAVLWGGESDQVGFYDLKQKLAAQPLNKACFELNKNIRLGAEALMTVSSRVGEDGPIFRTNFVKICKLGKLKEQGQLPVRLLHTFETEEQFTPDGEYLATSEPSVVRIWATGTGELMAVVRGPERQRPSLWFSPDNRFLAIRWHSELWVVASPSNRLVAVIPLAKDWEMLGWSTDGVVVVAQQQSRKFETWEIQPIQRSTRVDQWGFPTQIDFSSSGKEMLTVDKFPTPEGDEAWSIEVWSTETGGSLLRIRENFAHLGGGALRPDGNQLAVFPDYEGEEMGIGIHDMANNRFRKIPADDSLFALSHRPRQGWIGLEDQQGETNLIILATGVRRLLWRGPPNAWFLAGGRLIAGIDAAGHSRVFDVDRGREIACSVRVKLHPQMDILPTSDGRFLAVLSEGAATKVMDLVTGIVQTTLPVASVASRWSRDGSFLFTASEGTARVWDIPKGIEHARRRYTGDIKAVTFSPDSQRIALGEGAEVRLWAWRLEEIRQKTCEILADNRLSPNWRSSFSKNVDISVCKQRQ